MKLTVDDEFGLRQIRSCAGTRGCTSDHEAVVLGSGLETMAPPGGDEPYQSHSSVPAHYPSRLYEDQGVGQVECPDRNRDGRRRELTRHGTAQMTGDVLRVEQTLAGLVARGEVFVMRGRVEPVDCHQFQRSYR